MVINLRSKKTSWSTSEDSVKTYTRKKFLKNHSIELIKEPTWSNTTQKIYYAIKAALKNMKNNILNIKIKTNHCLENGASVTQYKPLTRILTTRITNKLDTFQSVEQTGFCRGYSTMDHLHTIRQIEKSQAC